MHGRDRREKTRYERCSGQGHRRRHAGDIRGNGTLSLDGRRAMRRPAIPCTCAISPPSQPETASISTVSTERPIGSPVCMPLRRSQMLMA
jgi:hypothetical protein